MGCKDELFDDCQPVIDFVSTFFGVKDFLRFSLTNCKNKLKKFNNKHSTLVVTGKTETSQYLSKIFNGKFYGCSGRCTVAISTNVCSLNELTKNISILKYKNSCTNFGAGFIHKNHRWYYNHTGRLLLVNNIGKTIEAIHPTVIYNIGVKDLNEIGRYHIINTDTSGAINSLVGFAADPKFFWPGDFLV